MNPIFLFRVSSFLYRKKIPFLPKMIMYLIRFVFSCYIPPSLNVGKRFVLGYGGLGVVIHARCIIGNDCHIDQNVTIGGTSKKDKVPVLGNSVYIGSGAVVLGPVTIGNNVVIGANSVVVTDIPANSLVVGAPGKVIKSGIKKCEYI